MSLPTGTRLGPYELVALLGAGGMGEVYRARDTRLDRTVAVKVLPRQLAGDPDRRARLEREARAVSSLGHPNICALFDVGHSDGIEYLVMEYLEGEPLARRLERGPLPLDQLLRIAGEVAGALEHAHRNGLVHRDLKPANVMLTRSGAKLLDFGIAKAVRGPVAPMERTVPERAAAGGDKRQDTQLTSEGAVVGTLAYMAPEQIEGRPVDPRTDVFAFGALLYEMATGRRAFEAATQASLIVAILERHPPPLGTLQPMSPPSLDRLVRLCLAKDPDDRWQSAHDVRLALEGVAEAVAPMLAAAAGERRRWVERIAWAALVLALLVTVAVARRPSAANGRRALRVSVVPPPGITSTGPFALSADGGQIAFVGLGRDGVPRLWVRALDAAESRELPGTEDASLPFWSPDGRSLGFFAQRQLKRIELAGGPPRALADITDSRGGSWGPDGFIVFAPNPGDGVYRIPADGGEVLQVTRLDPDRAESSHRWPVLLPGGRRVAYLVLSGERERLTLAVTDLDSGASERLVAADSGAAVAAPDRLLFVRGDTLLSQRLDRSAMRLVGDPAAIADGVWRDPDLDGLRAFAAGGAVVAYRRGGAELTRLLWFDRHGREIGALGASGLGSVVALSPDGRRVARSVTEPGATVAGLWLLDAEQQTSSRFTFNRWNDIYPVWSPDGRRIAFTSDRTGPYNLFVKEVDGAGEETALLPAEVWDFPEDWSRDGRLLAFSRRDRQTRGDVWVLDMSEREPRPLVRTLADELQPRFSPDARYLAYVSDESGRNEVYVQTMPPSAAKWQVSTAGGFQPQWRRDGRELYYLAPDLRLMAVPVARSDDGFAGGPPAPLFLTRIRRSILKGASPYVPGPDGQRFLIDSTIAPDLSSPIHLVIRPRG